MKERFSAQNPKSCMLRFHTQTGGVTLTAQQPDNNVVRVTIQALAAVLGGTQSLHTNSKDEALALPTEASVRTALRTQQVIAHESGIANTIDPFAGSFAVEQLTDELERDAEAIIQQIDEMGGMVPAIEQGWVQQKIEHAAYEYGQAIERGERIIVGVNKYQVDQEPDVELFEVSEEAAKRQRDKVQSVRSQRDEEAVNQALERITCATEGSDNMMPVILDAVRAYATVGEICRALQSVFGEYTESYV